MSERLRLATHKGVFTFERSTNPKRGPWTMGDVDFVGENATMLLHDGRDGAPTPRSGWGISG